MSFQPLEVIRFGSSEAMLDGLALHRELWSAYPKNWIFRGQGRSEWKLVPSAFRRESTFYYGGNEPYCVARSHRKQVQNEILLVRAFVEELEAQGVAIPGAEPESLLNVRALWQATGSEKAGSDWPPRGVLPLLGLAQHHGLPTRMLDWTHQPLIAAYFAALGAARLIETTKSDDFFLSVWALAGWTSTYFREAGEPFWKVIAPPRASNPNLRAQSGVFTVVIDPNQSETGLPVPPNLDDLVRERGPAIVERGGWGGTSLDEVAPILVRLELHASHAEKLLYYLDVNQISGTHLFPGFDGAVRGLRERAYRGALKMPPNWSEDRDAERQRREQDLVGADE